MVYDMVYKEGKNLVSDKQSVEIAKRIPLNDWKAERSGGTLYVFSAVDNETGMTLKLYREPHGRDGGNYGISVYRVQACANGEKMEKCVGGVLNSDYARRLFRAVDLNCVRK